MSDYGTKENPTTKAGLPTDRAKGHESAKDTHLSSDEEVTDLYVQVIDQANESAPVRYRPVLTDEIVSKIRSRVESGTIKGEVVEWCSEHGATIRKTNLCDWAWLNQHVAQEGCRRIRSLVIPVSGGGSET